LFLGYVINYKREQGDWEELQVEAGTTAHILSGLWCGTRYQLYITAYNIIGTGLPCDIVNAFTKGTGLSLTIFILFPKWIFKANGE
jgi:Fibronectin type III domain